MKKNYRNLWMILLLSALFPLTSYGQFTYKWMAIGNLHNWFSEVGCEIEVGRASGVSQQDGLQWPAIYDYQDCQAAKGFWIGTTDFVDIEGTDFPYKVVHVGPRVSGESEFYPTKFTMVSKFEPPVVTVDGVPSFDKRVENDSIAPDLPCERMIINHVNTSIGIKMERKILAWSQKNHDNYMVYEYTFTNTGNIDDDPEIEMPDNTLTGVYFFWQYRYSANFQTRYVVGNASGWGINTMIDARGDGSFNVSQYGDPPDENYRAQFAWHGYYPDKTLAYDNIGGPIFNPDPYGYNATSDTVGRLGAPQFMGILTVHADASPADPSDDPGQPSTTGYYGSDEDLQSNNDQYNKPKMATEYSWMKRGHQNPRHAWAVEPSGDFSIQKIGANIPPGEPGGFSIGNGYGPYDLAPGESITIVMAEVVDGLSREKCIEIGKQFKRGQINDVEKNQWVLTGKDSLMKRFKLITESYANGYSVPSGPLPPKSFAVAGGGDRINLTWEHDGGSDLEGFRVYRMTGRFDDPLIPPDLIYTAGPDEREYADQTPIRGISYYYYIEAFGNGFSSSRYYTQTYDPTFLTRPPGKKLSEVRVVPNPYIWSSAANRLRFGEQEPDKIAFFNIPGRCTIDIFTETGEHIYKIKHTDGSGDVYWKAVTSSNQVVVSGIYLAVIKDLDTGESDIVKFVIIR